MSQQPPPPDPYGQQPDPYAQQQPGYSQPGYPGGYGYAAPPMKKPLELGKIVFIAAWVVLGLYALRYIYILTQDDFAPDFGDRFLGNLDTLGVGIFYTGVLLTASKWLEKLQQD